MGVVAMPTQSPPPSPAESPPPSGAPAPPHAHLAAAIRVVSGLTIVSRIAGLARDVLTARIFGDTALGSAFRAAYAIPNLFRRLFGEGALSAAFLPEYTRLSRDDPRRAAELARIVVRLLILVTGGLTLAIELALLARLSFRAGPDLSLSLRLMMLMLPMMPMVCLTAVLGGMLQGHGRFAPPAAAPIILNLFQIVAGALFVLNVLKSPTTTAYAIAIAAVLASVAQIAWSLRALRGLVDWRAVGHAARENARAVWRRFLPACLGLGTLQLNTFLDTLLAMWPIWVGPTMLGRPVPLDEKSNGILSFTQTIYQFPLGVFGIAVATAVFPLLSRAADRPDEFAAMLRRGMRLSLFIALPASVGLFLVRREIVATVFSGSSAHAAGFSAQGLERSAAVLAGFSPAIWAYSLNHVLTRAYYARGDTTTPMRVAMAMVVLNLALNLTLLWPLRESGLAYATAISASIQCLTLLALSRGKLHAPPLDRETLLAFARIALTSALMGAVVLALSRALPVWSGWWGSAARLGVLCLAGAGSYAGLSTMMRVPELRWLFERAPRSEDGKAIPMSFE